MSNEENGNQERKMDFHEAAQQFANHLRKNLSEFAALLDDYESFFVVDDEIQRTLASLENLQEIEEYLMNSDGSLNGVESTATFLPLNMPIYTLVLFGVLPSFMSRRAAVRCPEIRASIVKNILPLLNLNHFFPNVTVSFDNHATFVKKYVSSADVVVFSGREQKAAEVLRQCKQGSTFLFNGWGCNPIVIFPGCKDLALAAQRLVEFKTYNAGQDCAGPDTILVHESVAEQFATHLKHYMDLAKVGTSYSDRAVVVGPLAEGSNWSGITKTLLKYRKYIVKGGQVDFQHDIVWPTAFVVPIKTARNYEKFFWPSMFINTFNTDDDLKLYFDSPYYKRNAMYVSLYGCDDESRYSNTFGKVTTLKDTTVLEFERGNSAYGGFNLGASFVARGGRKVARPILFAREMALHALSANEEGSKFLSKSTLSKIFDEFQNYVTSSFGENLVFAFICGSVAKGYARHRHNIDTMVLLRNRNAEQESAFVQAMKQLHEEVEMVLDTKYPSEILSIDQLDAAIRGMSGLSVGRHNSADTFDLVVWGDILAGRKIAITGDRKLLNLYTRACIKFPAQWSEQIVQVVAETPDAQTTVEETDDFLELIKKLGITFDDASHRS